MSIETEQQEGIESCSRAKQRDKKIGDDAE